MATITATLSEGYAVDLRTSSGHRWAADEPTAVGGTDTGPNPYELLLGALAACTSITVSMYAQRKGWAFDGIEVRYEHDRIHVEDCADCEQHQRGYIDRIVSHVTIRGDLDEAQRTRLAQVAASCPVHKTLDKGVHLVDNVSFA
ncbi:MAG: OsmC family protein [Nitriliruptoraceae bacterium]